MGCVRTVITAYNQQQVHWHVQQFAQRILSLLCRAADRVEKSKVLLCKLRSVSIDNGPPHAARQKKCSAAFGGPLSIETDRSLQRRTLDFSTRSAARHRSDRMHCANCWMCQWTYCWLWAVIIVRTRPISLRWAKKNCRPISCSTRRGWFPLRRSSTTTCTRNAK